MKSIWIRLPIILTMVVFASVLILSLAWGYCIYQDVYQLRRIAGEAKALKAGGLQAEDLPKACDLAFHSASAVEQLQSDLTPLFTLASNLEKVPNVSSYLFQVQTALDYLNNLSQAGIAFCDAGLPLLQDLSQVGASNVLAPGFATRLSARIPDLLQAKIWLEQASQCAGMIDSRLIPVEYRDDFTSLNTYIPLALQALDAIAEMPAVLELVTEARIIQERGLGANTLEPLNKLTVRAGEVSGNLKVVVQPVLPLLHGLEPDSQAGQYFGQADLLIDYLYNLSRAGTSLSHAVLPLLEEDRTGDGDSVNMQPGWYRVLVDSQAEIEEAQDWIRKATEVRARIDIQRLPADYQSRLAAADQLLAQAPHILSLLRTMPRLMGADEPQTYLIMVQNRDELRATGGFITAFGLLQLDHGKLASLKIEGIDSNYMSEERQAPEAMRYLMDAYYLVPRDANWSPDFPTAARRVQDIYALSVEDIHTDGAIAFDQGLLVKLLEFLGPLELPDGTTVNASNIQAIMVQYKEAASSAGQGNKRKEFMEVMAPALIDKIRSIRQPQRQVELGKLLYQQVQQGHLQVFFNDPQGQQNLHSLGLDGAVRPEEGDFLMLVDSNVGFSKVDAFIKRSLEYEVNLSDPHNPLSTVHMRYQHTQAGTEPCHQGVPDIQDLSSLHYYYSRCYWDYWRLLMEGGVSLRSTQSDPVPASYFDDNQGWKNEVEVSAGENGTKMFAGLVVVPQGQAKDVVLNTRLPSTVITKSGEKTLVYRLRIQKQAGIERLPVKIKVTGPRGYFLSSPPPGFSYDRMQNFATWQGDIYGFQDLYLEFTSEYCQ